MSQNEFLQRNVIEIMAQLTRFVVRKQLSEDEAAELAHSLAKKITDKVSGGRTWQI